MTFSIHIQKKFVIYAITNFTCKRLIFVNLISWGRNKNETWDCKKSNLKMAVVRNQIEKGGYKQSTTKENL